MKCLWIAQTVDRIGKQVELYGWVETVRDHKKVVFVDLKDRSGVVQAVGGEEISSLKTGSVIYIKGNVKKRPEHLVNDKIATGKIEVEVVTYEVLSSCEPLPIPTDTDGYEIDEEARLSYRYLDLRRDRLMRNITTRARFVQLIREYLFEKDFIEIETPLLTKATPEGSRDFLVPSRLVRGSFYALPQSPQQYKQLLMVAGVERYFQIAKCLRDEDLRADRGFEHTQIDLEMSFVTERDLMEIVENLIVAVFEKMGAIVQKKPFPVFTWEEALSKFGADKFDLRSDEEKKENVQAFAWVVHFPFFEKDGDGRWTYTHNPFSDPLEEDKEDFLKGKVEGIRTAQYDLVCNGFEAGGGSIRSTDPRILEKVFETIGHKKEEIKDKFGHIFKAFSYGVPPHGGIALGVERLLMSLLEEKTLREVVAFPQTSGGKTSVMDAPSIVTNSQLDELGLSINERKKIT